MNKRRKNHKLTPRKLEGLIRTKFENISDKELTNTLTDLKKFAQAAYRIATEPQYKTYIRKDKKKVYETDISEFKKVLKSKKSLPLKEAFEEYQKVIDKNES